MILVGMQKKHVVVRERIGINVILDMKEVL